MKVWLIAGAFFALSTPSAFALESLIDSPPDTRPYSAQIQTGAPDANAAKRAAKQTPPAPVRNAAARRRVEADEETRRARTEAQRRRRSPALDRVPDASLIERRGAL